MGKLSATKARCFDASHVLRYMTVTGCSGTPKKITIVYCFYIMSLLGLFAHFFNQT